MAMPPMAMARAVGPGRNLKPKQHLPEKKSPVEPRRLRVNFVESWLWTETALGYQQSLITV